MEKIKPNKRIEEIDKNMSFSEVNSKGIKWLSPMDFPFRLSGFAWINKDKLYRRLPLNPSWSIPEAVDSLADRTAGGQICFRTDALKLIISVKLSNAADMYQMPATGQCGFDCYLGEPERLHFCSVTKYDHNKTEYESTLYEVNDRKLRTVVLNFPLYREVEQVKIGVDEQSKILKPLPLRSEKPVIFYGTSITQGGCASRPGMAYTNIISRCLNVECINLGFAASGHGEPEMARIITEIKNPGCIVLDYEANRVSNETFHKTLPEFIKILRSVHREVPILIVSKIRFACELIKEDEYKDRVELKEFQFNLVEELKNNGDKKIYFYDGAELLGSSFDECTVDGIHPTDLGFLRMAEKLAPVIEKIIFM